MIIECFNFSHEVQSKRSWNLTMKNDYQSLTLRQLQQNNAI